MHARKPGSEKAVRYYPEIMKSVTFEFYNVFAAGELAKEPPNGRFPDWLNLRVQRPKAAKAAGTSGRMRSGKRAKGKEDKSESQDVQTFQVSRQSCTQPRILNSRAKPRLFICDRGLFLERGLSFRGRIYL